MLSIKCYKKYHILQFGTSRPSRYTYLRFIRWISFFQFVAWYSFNVKLLVFIGFLIIASIYWIFSEHPKNQSPKTVKNFHLRFIKIPNDSNIENMIQIHCASISDLVSTYKNYFIRYLLNLLNFCSKNQRFKIVKNFTLNIRIIKSPN